MGVPVVTMNSGGMAELVEDGKTGVLVSSPTPEGVADAVKKCLGNEELYQDIKKNCEAIGGSIMEVREYCELLINKYIEEMERRYNLLNPLCVRNVEAYNEKVTADPSLGEPLPKIIIVIDEFADLMLQVKDPVEALVTRIAQKARAAGIHLVIGTQRPSVNVITGVIKANVPSRISCKVMSNVDSKTVLDSAGAEKLLDRGDALYAPAG